jgi:tRNA pseudouridine38-40 synthase
MDIVDSWDFDLVLRLNHMLPRDIAIYDILPVEGRLHARYDAVLRTYDYFIHTRKDPFLSESSALYLRDKLNVSEMGKAVALLPKYQDYGAYCKSPGKNEHNICRVSSATLFVDDSGTRIRFSISSNRFLGRMIRILAHKLIEISDGTFSVAEFESHLISRQPPSLIPPAHAEGLYLSKVSYPSLDLPTREDFQPNRDRQGDFWKEI